MSTVVEGNLSKVDIGEEVEWAKRTHVVKESCRALSGYWSCVTHDATFRHNLAKDSHIAEPGQHTLAWICPEHGPEVP